MKLKERIPNESTLVEIVERDIVAVTGEVRSEVGSLEVDYIKYRRHQRIGFIIIIAAFLVPNIVSSIGLFSNLDEISFVIGIVSLIICIAFGFKLTITGNKVIDLFNSGVNDVLYNKIFFLLGISGRLLKPEMRIEPTAKNLFLAMPNISTGKTIELLNQSELITSTFNRVQIDNSYDIAIGNSNLYVSELDVKFESRSSKNNTVVPLFKGYFVSFTLDKTLDGKTFVSTEGDELSFGHRSLFTDMGAKGVRETKLEWNQFEDKLHVATDNEVEARYILSTDFMSDLYEWWEGQKGHIRISFIGNHMFLLFPNEKIRFDATIDKIGEKEVKEYLLTIAKPLLHVVHLAETIQL